MDVNQQLCYSHIDEQIDDRLQACEDVLIKITTGRSVHVPVASN